MNGFVFRLLSVLGLLMSSGVVKAQTWIPFDKQEGGKHVSTEVIKSDPTEYIVKVTIHGLTDNLITNENGQFHRISIGRDAYLSKVGEPSLPIISQLIAIPTGSRLSARITDEQWTDIEIGRILPKQKPLLESEQPKGFDYDVEVYRDSYIPTLLNVSESMQWRDIHNTAISVCPFKYYPQENRLSVMKEFVLHVSFEYEERNEVRSFSNVEDPYCLFDNIPYTDISLIQPRNDSGTARSGNNDNYNYLIIVGSVPGVWNSEKLKEFQRWKALKGYKTKAVSTSVTGTDPEDIKSYIQQEYNNGVRYVLFVGDYEKIKSAEIYTPWSTHFYSDYWYGCFGNSNDPQAWIPIGRFSVETSEQFANIVDKTIKYEKKYNFSNGGLLMAHFEGAPAPWSYQGCCEQIYEDHSGDMLFTKAYGANGATNADVLTVINNGTNIVNYRGHGSPILWGKKYGDEEEYIYTWNVSGEAFPMSKINNMNNETCAVFFSVACQTGKITEDSCMLEAFTRSDHGAVAFLGATDDIDPDVNNGYNQLLYDKLLGNHIFHLGDLNMSAHIANYLSSLNLPSNDDYKDTPFCYICGGDPSLELWTATPQNMDVDWTINNGYMTVHTNLTGSYYVTIASMNGERLDSIACSNNTCTFPIPTNLDTFFIAVNKHNYYPHIIRYDSVESEIANITFDEDAYFTASPLDIICNDPATEEGTIIKSGHKVGIKNGNGGVKIWDNFKCEIGARFEVK